MAGRAFAMGNSPRAPTDNSGALNRGDEQLPKAIKAVDITTSSVGNQEVDDLLVLQNERAEDFYSAGEEDAAMINVGAVMDKSPLSVHENTGVSEVFLLVRRLELQQITVVDRGWRVKGIITRRSLMDPHREADLAAAWGDDLSILSTWASTDITTVTPNECMVKNTSWSKANTVLDDRSADGGPSENSVPAKRTHGQARDAASAGGQPWPQPLAIALEAHSIGEGPLDPGSDVEWNESGFEEDSGDDSGDNSPMSTWTQQRHLEQRRSISEMIQQLYDHDPPADNSMHES